MTKSSMGRRIRYRLKELEQIVSRGDLKQAQSLLAELVREFPYFTPAQELEALLCFHLGDKQGALELTKQALVQYPNSEDLLLRHAGLLLKCGKRDEAESFLCKAVNYVESAGSVNRLMETLESQGVGTFGLSSDFEEAFQSLATASHNTWEEYFIIPIVVWGENFVHTFMQYTVRLHMSPGNLGHLAGKVRVKYLIYTTRPDYERIRSYPTWAFLLKMAEIEILFIEEIFTGDKSGYGKYDCALICHRHAAEAAYRKKAKIIFLTPDCIVAEGCFKRLHELSIQGKNFVYVAALRMDKESFFERMDQCMKADGVLNLTPRQAVRLTLEFLHHTFKAFYWDSDIVNNWPSVLLWRGGESIVVQRCFHMHPILITPHEYTGSINISIDKDAANIFMKKFKFNELHVIEDSDELYVAEVTSKYENPNPVREGRFNIAEVRKWMDKHADISGRFFGAHCVIHHGDELNSLDISALEESNRIMKELLCCK